MLNWIFCRYIYFVKNCYEDRTDDISEMMLEQVLRSGTESASDLIVHMFRRLELLPRKFYEKQRKIF